MRTVFSCLPTYTNTVIIQVYCKLNVLDKCFSGKKFAHEVALSVLQMKGYFIIHLVTLLPAIANKMMKLSTNNQLIEINYGIMQ